VNSEAEICNRTAKAKSRHQSWPNIVVLLKKGGSTMATMEHRTIIKILQPGRASSSENGFARGVLITI
jgi:hypothetical protein